MPSCLKASWDTTRSDAFGSTASAGSPVSARPSYPQADEDRAESAVKKGMDGWGIWDQFGVQLAAVGITIVYAAVLTLIILVVVNKVVGLRAKPEAEMAGMDHAFHGNRIRNAPRKLKEPHGN
jgi:Amt family ammonium transporter